MKVQQNLFDLIKSKLLPQFRLADVISDLLEVSQDAAYRRMRGDKELTLSELHKLCNHFNISMDQVINNYSNKVLFQQSSTCKNDLKGYCDDLKEMADSFESISLSSYKKISCCANDIPLFHLIQFPNLLYFKLYAWIYTENNNLISFEKFLINLEKEKINYYYAKIYQCYEKIPSTEIWNNTTIDIMIHQLDYYFDLNYFENNKTFQLLCDQLLLVIESLDQWTAAKKKKPLNVAPFNMYLSPVHSKACVILSQWNDKISVTFNLSMVNTITTSNRSFCEETDEWIDSLLAKSLYLSGASLRERFQFFQSMKNKVNKLKNKQTTPV